MLVEFLSMLLLAVGLYLIAADILRLPYLEASRAVRNLGNGQKSITSGLDLWLGDVAKWLAAHIRINEFKRQALEADLRTAQMNLTPEQFKANALIKAGIIAFLALPASFIAPAVAVLCFALSLWIYRRENAVLTAKIRKKREKIEEELPRLVGTITKNLNHGRDVLQMLKAYAKGAGPELQDELTITVADMQSGNYEQAITRLQARIGSAMMNDVCRGLIGILAGDATEVYWSSLQIKFSDHQRQVLRRQALKAPAKIRRLSLCMLLCMIAMYFVVILTHLVDSLGILFG